MAMLPVHKFDFLALDHLIAGYSGFPGILVGFFKAGAHIAVLNVKAEMLYRNIKDYLVFNYGACDLKGVIPVHITFDTFGAGFVGITS